MKPERATVSRQKIDVDAGIMQEVECSVGAARPAADITWTLNDRDITSQAHMEQTPINPDVSF